jgi:hypothetical protein
MKTIALSTTAAIIVLSTMTIHAFAYQNYQHYSQGWNDGQTNAQDAWKNGMGYDPLICNGEGHTHDYCQGYIQGYNEYWHRAQAVNSDSNNNEAENNASISINGNNNHVNVNQINGQNSGSDSSNGGNSPDNSNRGRYG